MLKINYIYCYVLSFCNYSTVFQRMNEMDIIVSLKMYLSSEFLK